jgi:hypothetical protein
LLLLHEVCGCRTIMNFTDLMDFAGELQDSFGSCSFARIYVGKDTDVTVAGQVFHGDSLVEFWKLGKRLAHHILGDAFRMLVNTSVKGTNC